MALHQQADTASVNNHKILADSCSSRRELLTLQQITGNEKSDTIFSCLRVCHLILRLQQLQRSNEDQRLRL